MGKIISYQVEEAVEKNPLKRLWYAIISSGLIRAFNALSIITLVIAVPLTIFLSRQKQDIRQSAQTVNESAPLQYIAPTEKFSPSIFPTKRVDNATQSAVPRERSQVPYVPPASHLQEF